MERYSCFNSVFNYIRMKQLITACKQYCLAPAHAGQHKATSPTRKTLCVILKDILPLVSGNAITDCVGTDIPAIIRGSTVSILCFGSIGGENPSGDYLRESKNRL